MLLESESVKEDAEETLDTQRQKKRTAISRRSIVSDNVTVMLTGTLSMNRRKLLRN